jgi:signal transduction histidine kinase
MGALLLLALWPLLLAVQGLTRSSLEQVWQRDARALGRAIAGHIGEARRARGDGAIGALLDAQLGQDVGAIAVYDARGRQLRRAGSPPCLDALPAHVSPAEERVEQVSSARGPALLVVVPAAVGPVAALLHTDPAAVRAGPVVRLFAAYVALLGLLLLVLSYFALTRIAVSPIERLSRAARRVAQGARALDVPRAGGRELVQLGASLATMTGTLRAEEEQLRQKVSELGRATAELKRAHDTVVRSERLASVGRLAAGLAHEIGNPIAAILAFQELLADSASLSDDERDFLVRMRRETERVSRVLRDLLDFARPAAAAERGEPDERASASVRAAIEHVVQLVRPQKAFARVELLTALEGELPLVAMRSDRIEQVLLNLLLNAADAMAARGGQVSIKATAEADAVEVVIEDEGGGIDPTVRERLFEPFVTTKEVGKGTGLGLAVCRGLVEAAGGSIRVADGRAGARFVLALPPATPSEDG